MPCDTCCMDDAELLRWLLRAVAQEPGLRSQVEGRLDSSGLSPIDKQRLHNLLDRAAWFRADRAERPDQAHGGGPCR